MSDPEDAEEPPEEDAAEDADGDRSIVSEFETRLDGAAEALDAADTEADLDEVESTLDAIESDIESAEFPEPEEPEDEDEEPEDPAAEIESRLSELRDELEENRGPYAEDAIEAIEEQRATIDETRWTEAGEVDVLSAVDTAVEEIEAEVDVDDTSVYEIGSIEAAIAAIETAIEEIEAADLDPDGDGEAIAALLETAERLADALEDAEEWSDLEVREQLLAEGYYDVLGHYKDYPPEWAALKEHEKRGNTDMVLLALDSLDSDYMEEHCLDALKRMGRRAATDEAIEAMLDRAGKRDEAAIEILGKMRADEAVETLLEYVDSDNNPQLQKVTFKALGEIGAEDAVGPIANKLVMDNDNVRPHAARALGLLGDARAIEPLSDTLRTDDDDNVRASAAWALRQIGTKRALERVASLESDRSFVVDTEIQKAIEQLDAAAPAP